ncbi:MAG: hypothetical protein GC190_03740 [Alphaproteobacteria bacterium]|nr:hypothetical protein [Alphaproteobacteria bacterium]
MIWIGLATLVLAGEHPARNDGFAGGFAGFAVAANRIATAVANLVNEFGEHGYLVVGLEGMLPVSMLDREMTEHEAALVEATKSYPVQFKNVHLHPSS